MEANNSLISSVAKSAEEKRKKITELDEASAGDPLLLKPPSPELLYTLDELGFLLKELIGLEAPRDETGRILDVRPKGMWFEWEVAKLLGYTQRAKTGTFPDMRHQLMETKHHIGKSITIDFGRHYPGSLVAIPGAWNKKTKYKETEVRYLVALAPPPDFQIVTLIIKTGEQLVEAFGGSITQTIKYQMGISDSWRKQYIGKIICGTKILSV